MNLDVEEKRQALRRPRALAAVIAVKGEAPVACEILDHNDYGARLDIGEHEAAERFFLIDLESSVFHEARVVWRQAPLVGTRFLDTGSLASPAAPAWVKAAWTEALRERAQQRGIRLVWSAPGP